MANEDDVTRRSRRLLGEAPEVFGTPLLRIPRSVVKPTDGAQAASQQTVTEEIFCNTLSVCSRKSGKRSVNSKSSIYSEAMQKKILAEIESMQRLGKAEDEFLLARLEREKRIEEKRLQMTNLQLEDEIGSDKSDDEAELPEEILGQPNLGERVSSWFEDNQRKTRDVQGTAEIPKGIPKEPKAEAPRGVQAGETSDPMLDMNMRLEKLMARQTIPKELPTFSGEPEEWPMFLHQYHRTTQLCGLSDDENVVRLFKCLKGKAREAVLPILGLPENLGLIMDTLEAMFGRSDQIVKAMIANVKAAPSCTRSKPENIIVFSNLVSNLVATMKHLKRCGQLYNPLLLEELILKLPVEQQFKWCDRAKHFPDEPTLEHFQYWLSDVAMTARMMPTTNITNNEKPADNKKKDKRSVFLATQKEDRKCLHCSQDGHKFEDCKGFLSTDIQSRWKSVKNNRVCYSCLIPGHRSTDCRKKIVCGVDGCDKSHNKLLHKTATKPAPTAEDKVGEISGHVRTRGNNQVLLRILPVKLYGPKGELATYAMLDDGSTVTMIDTQAADLLGLTGEVDPLCVQWTNDLCREEKDSRSVSLEITGANEGKRFKLQNARTVAQMALPHQTIDMNAVRANWLYLQDVPFQTMVKAQPLILIGSDNILLITARKLRQGHWNDPVATKTWLGWVVHGNIPKNQRLDNSLSFHACERPSEDDELNQLVKTTWSTESFGVRVVEQPRRSMQDERALLILQATTKREGNRFQTGLLWKADNLHLPESRCTAVRRLHCMERKMDRDPAFSEAYCSKIQDYLAKGYCRKLTPEEVKRKGPRTFYLPHFGVFNPNKPGKLRLVFDAAARSHGVSLNDCLLKGPDFLNPLPGVLMRFRRHKVGIVGDIREMFHQVRIIPEDVDSQRFLWRGKDRTGDPEEFIMQVMIFGAACSPASALYIKDLNAMEFEREFPEVAASCIKNTYMDDNLHGANSDEEAASIITRTIDLFGRGGFSIVNWASSSRAVIKSLSPELRAKGLVSIPDDTMLPVERVLGLNWDAEDDKFVFCTNFPKVKEHVIICSRPPTRREIASLVMSIYDPLGLVAQFTIKGRILLQEAWLLKSGWDDAIPEDMFRKWKWWVEQLKSIVNVRVPRCYSTNLGEAKNTELHIFVDASSQAFACVAYIRVEYSTGVDMGLVLARARVAPLKPLTIPKLELQAAVMGSRLAMTIQKEIQVPLSSRVYWSDSQTVLSWIRSEVPSPRQFVASRVGEILELSEVGEWRWVPTALNVADEATRSNTEINFQPSCRWYQGPEFLRLSKENWPRETATAREVPDDEEEPAFNLMIIQPCEFQELPDCTRFSSWLKLVRSTAWYFRCLQRFLHRLNRSPDPVNHGELSSDELYAAKVVWWKATQNSCFHEELYNLRKGRPIPISSRLKFLSPFLDIEGVLRMRGRIELTDDLSAGTKCPVILDPKHRFTQLIILYLHEQSAHQGVESVLNELRSNYWVLNGRAAVKKGFRDCQKCKIRKVRPNPPEMGPLPLERITRADGPFTFTGVDYFGPIAVSQQRKKVKRYGVLFTCLSIRAIHLEIAPDLSTDAAINAIRRFTSRRGVPEIMWSDNGTNFRGANRELQQALSELDVDKIQRTFSEKGMNWKFNPPSSPHMGGVWERMVKAVKTSLSSTLNEHTPKEDVLATLFAEAEFIINNRPLTHVSVDPSDPECLTPNHFLIGRKLGHNVPGRFGDGNFNLRSQWRLVQELSEKLWSRWLKEYLPTLARRTKWHQHTAPTKVGDIVVIADKDGPRNSWPIGRIINVYPGKDGQVRVVDVKTNDGIYKRPVVKICVLDVMQCDEGPGHSSGGRNVTAQADGVGAHSISETAQADEVRERAH